MTTTAQPLLASARRAVETLRRFGEPVPDGDVPASLASLVLVELTVDERGYAAATALSPRVALVQHGWRSYLLRIVNPLGVVHPLTVYPSGLLGHPVTSSGMVARPWLPDTVEFAPAVEAAWLEARVDGPPQLTGAPEEYRVLSLYARDDGEATASLAFTRSISILDVVSSAAPDADRHAPWWSNRSSALELRQRSYVPGAAVSVSFEADRRPAREVVFEVADVDGRSAVAAITIADEAGRVYPSRAMRLAPDMHFQDHVYRTSGESVRIPDGVYRVTAWRGPEYHETETSVTIDAASTTIPVSLARWVDPGARGYYSGDPHLHGGGCSHYALPTQGVAPETMIRHARGEGLTFGSVLIWGPCYYHQKRFFSGDTISPPAALESPDLQAALGVTWEPKPSDRDAETMIHYDMEISGFPSSHSGHLILLGLRDQDYPGTTQIEDWPSWNLPILTWAKAQGATTGFAHCGLGLGTSSRELPNLEIPPFSGPGAAEMVVDAAHGMADFMAGAEIEVSAELNLWYHLLNVGYRPIMMGETDYPCMFDDRPGVGRTYVRLPEPPSGPRALDAWLAGLREGSSYFGDGRSHVFDLAVDGSPARDHVLAEPGSVRVTATVAAWLPGERPEPPRGFSYDMVGPGADQVEPQDWHVEWSRIPGTRRVPVELVVNGESVARVEIEADGGEHEVAFDVDLARSSWIALRILPSVHTQPVVVEVAGAPVRASRRSAEWLGDCVDALWEIRNRFIREAERPAARAAYDVAKSVYAARAGECS